MAASYKQFLAAPSSSLLADTASLHYVTTTTSISGSTQIIQHFNGLQKQVVKKKEDILDLVDGHSAIAVEVDTGLEFKTGGGPYLPGLDDNFLASRTVYLPITHIVTFDADGKIAQIRLQWDQGSLLKQVDVIGKSGRNWPIRDSREQISFIQTCLKSAGTGVAIENGHNETVVRTRNSSSNAMRDPHASLKLFGPREEIEDLTPANVVSPYAGTRPRQRSFTEILGDEPDSPSANHARSMSPSKAGQGKNFHPPRLFEGQDEQPEDIDVPKAKKYIRPNPKRFSHFDFADGSDPADAPQAGLPIDERPKSKHDSQWSFQDFVTPQKPKAGKAIRHQDVRHWDTDKDALGETPAKPAVKLRWDAEAHFELLDDGERVPQPHRPGAKPKGATHNEGLGLYKNQLFDEDDAPDQALGNITNLKDRGKDFDPHFEINDASPANPHKTQHVPEARKKAVKMMDANWSNYEQSPVAKKENRPTGDNKAFEDQRIHISGDGMGGRKGTNRDWLYGESQDVAAQVPGRKLGPNAAQNENQHPDQRIHIAGDSMGGKKGTNRDWLYGESDNTPKAIPTRKPGGNAAQDSEPQKQRIHIAGDGMGGKKGTNRDWLYGESEEIPKAVPTRKPGSNDVPETETQQQRIHIAGDGMGGKKGTNRDWLYGEAEETSQAIPTRKPGGNVAQGTENKNQRIHIAGDGMGGKKGTNRDWLYGEGNENAENQKPTAAAADKKSFWDF